MTELQLLPESETIINGMKDILYKKDQNSEREKEFLTSSCKITRLHWSTGTRICKHKRFFFVLEIEREAKWDYSSVCIW